MNPPASEEDRQRLEAFQRTHKLGLATLFFSDLVGSTQLKQHLGDRRAGELIQAHHAAFREVLASFQNAEEIHNAGDSFFLVFATPSDAVRFALLVQARSRAMTSEDGSALRDRIGIHVGEVFIEAPAQPGLTKDFSGIQVDTCARIMSLGEGDQILLSRFAFDNARQAMRGDAIDGIGQLAWFNHGYYQVKGVEAPVEICEVGELGCARLEAPASGEKAQRVVTDDEPVPGWRPAAGQIVPATRWLLERLLGEGGFGEVWLARHQSLKDRRVFKFCFNAEHARSLKREVTLFRVLREHVGARPGIVAVHDIFFDEPPYYIVMDYVDGPTLTGWAEAHAPLDTVPLAVRLEIVAQIADALQTAHDAGVIHRDVKPSNILIAEAADSSLPVETAAPRAMLTDFGIGQIVSKGALDGITPGGFTQTVLSADSLTGTQLYLAPEVLAGQPATIRSDLYALGVVLYQLVTGALNRPLTSDWADDLADPLLREDIRHCVAGDPAKRFSGGAQLATHLRRIPERRAEKKAAERLQARTARRKRQMQVLALMAAVVAIAAVIFAVAFYRERDLKAKIAREGERAESALTDLRGTAPLFEEQARELIGRRAFPEALARVDAALQLAPTATRHQLRGDLLQSLHRFAESAEAYESAVRSDPANVAAAEAGRLSRELAATAPSGGKLTSVQQRRLFGLLQKQKRDTEASLLATAVKASLREQLPIWQVQIDRALGPHSQNLTIEGDGKVTLKLSDAGIKDIGFLRGMTLHNLRMSNNGIEDLSPLKGMPLEKLILFRNQIRDLTPLAEMPLSELSLESNPDLENLGPIAGVPLERLGISQTRVRDLTPLRGMPLRRLSIGQDTLRSPVSDLSALRGMPLEWLSAKFTSVTDLRPLAGSPLRVLDIVGSTLINDLSPLLNCRQLTAINLPEGGPDVTVLRHHTSLQRLGRVVFSTDITTVSERLKPAAEFWTEYDAQQAAKK